MIRTSEQIDVLSEALAKAQAKFSAAIKGSQNPAFRSKYADLSAVIDATVEHLNAEGICCMQHPMLEYKGEGDTREAFVTVTTRLQHKSGQWMESDLSVPAVMRDRFDAQSVGSGITYACRYALQSIGMVPREDDDGNAATGTGSKDAAKAVAQRKIAQSGKAPTQTKVDTLFYTTFQREKRNGNETEVVDLAEFINIPQYLASNPDREHEVRFAVSAAGAKETKEHTWLIRAEKLEHLLNVLAGDSGITVHKLKPGVDQ
jgi:hypothetical protein